MSSVSGITLSSSNSSGEHKMQEEQIEMMSCAEILDCIKSTNLKILNYEERIAKLYLWFETQSKHHLSRFCGEIVYDPLDESSCVRCIAYASIEREIRIINSEIENLNQLKHKLYFRLKTRSA